MKSKAGTYLPKHKTGVRNEKTKHSDEGEYRRPIADCNRQYKNHRVEITTPNFSFND
ncbi:hypothetical protein VCR14J2_380150 [Vibrio coralliirubri]|nr:hypothetical protein VCR14J2_380150 [Vibrio coralliirubri]